MRKNNHWRGYRPRSGQIGMPRFSQREPRSRPSSLRPFDRRQLRPGTNRSCDAVLVSVSHGDDKIQETGNKNSIKKSKEKKETRPVPVVAATRSQKKLIFTNTSDPSKKENIRVRPRDPRSGQSCWHEAGERSSQSNVCSGRSDGCGGQSHRCCRQSNESEGQTKIQTEYKRTWNTNGNKNQRQIIQRQKICTDQTKSKNKIGARSRRTKPRSEHAMARSGLPWAAAASCKHARGSAAQRRS